MPSVMIDIVMATTVFGVTINRKKMGSYLDYSCMTMTSYGMQMALGVLLGFVLQKIWTSGRMGHHGRICLPRRPRYGGSGSSHL